MGETGNIIRDLLTNGPGINIKFRIRSRSNKAAATIPANVDFDPLSLFLLLFAFFLAMFFASVVAKKIVG